MAEEPGDAWAAWLRERLDTHPTIRTNADLVRAGGLKDNGRPRIDASTVTQWLRGRRPSFQLALVTADAFGVDPMEVLMVAGYPIEGWEGRMVVLDGDGSEIPTVGGDAKDADKFVSAPGKGGESGVSNEDVLRAIQEMRAAVEALSERLAERESDS